jgi:archaemetzincin
MSGNLLIIICILGCMVWVGCTSSSTEPQDAPRPDASKPADAPKPKPPTVKELRAMIKKLRPLHQELGKPKRGEWLAEHFEAGQTFEEYLKCNPVTLHGRRNKIYIQPLGEFTETQRKIVTLTAEFMRLYFNAPVEIKKDLPLSIVPAEARRFHPSWVDENDNRIPQILSTYVLDKMLKPRLPNDAVAFIAFTTSDLWPGRSWNFVFGQASTREHVGVWSIYRFGKPERSEEEFRCTLLRTMKTGTHETGHMFTMHHCIKYECNMCGSNHLPESDSRPVWLCPECVAKVCYATTVNPVERYKKLAEFCKEHGFKTEQEFYEKSAKALGGGK